MKKALICIDYTNDFVASDGKLTCGEPGRMIEEAIVNLTEEFITNGDYVVLAVDSHDEGDQYHPETRLFLRIISKARMEKICTESFCLYIRNMNMNQMFTTWKKRDILLLRELI